MRPIRLEVEGFTAFRQHTEVDFSDTDLFVLWGPTGSGKSSLIDAMTFALYGSVPRYNDPRLVYPVISQGRQEARVRFDFTIDGEPYTVARVVRRVKRGGGWGASTKEARLESGDRVLAGTERELDEEVRNLFGLTFGQFTTCVVLPQGEFARFLHETPGERQGLLKELLGIRLYEQIAVRARSRASAAEQRAAVLAEQLRGLQAATPAAKREAGRRARLLNTLLQSVEKSERELQTLRARCEEQTAELATQSDVVRLLAGMKLPSAVPTLVEDQKKAQAAVHRGVKHRQTAELSERKAEEALKKLGEPDSLENALATYERLAKAQEEHRVAQQIKSRSERTLAEAEDSLSAATAAVEAVERRLEALRREHAAYHLARELAPGDECPVCKRPIDEVVPHHRPLAVPGVERERSRAVSDQNRARESYRTSLAEDSRNQERTAQLESQLKQLRKTLREVPAAAQLHRRLHAIAEATEKHERTREEADRARSGEREAMAQLETANRRQERAWDEFLKCRDTVSMLGPPAARKGDLQGTWKGFLAWCLREAKRAGRAVETADARAKELSHRMDAISTKIASACAEAGVEIGDAKPRDVVVEALASAREQVRRVSEELARLRQFKNQLAAAKSDAAIASSLARHLNATHFERWLLRTAFDRLVVEASTRLRELTGGDYSLEVDERLNFDVIDHRNADERRSARTLSGGETFLASLALALTLSEQVAGLAAEGAAKLESMFLDEGFGSLDGETLETVAATIEELGSTGRTIGLVTHVRELADRVPVKYSVTKGPATAVVERTIA